MEMDSGDSDITDEFNPIPSGNRSMVPLRLARYANDPRVSDHVLERILCCWRDIWIKSVAFGMKRMTYHDTLHAPFVLSVVSHRWRDIALRTPELWSHIHVDCGSRKNTTSLAGRLQTMIDRSGNVPITLYLENLHDAVSFQPWYHDMVARLAPTSRRWVRVVISCVTANDVRMVSDRWRLLCPGLREVSIYCKDDLAATALPATFLAQCPNIRRIDLRNIAWSSVSDFSSLRKIVLGPSHESLLTQPALLSMLRATPTVEYLKLLAFDDANIPLPSSASRPPILPRLRHLCVSPILFRTSLRGYETAAALPGLLEVSIHFSVGEEPDPMDDEENARREADLLYSGRFLKQHRVQNLKLSGLESSHRVEWIRQFFQVMTTSRLTLLQLRECGYWTTEIVRLALQRTPLAPVSGLIFLMPTLQSLFLTRCSQVNGAEILQFMQTRPARLHEVVIRKTDIDPHHYALIKQHVL